MHRRHPHYRLGDPETITGDFTTPAAPLAPRAAGGGFLTPKTGGTMIGAGLLLGLGVVGYYVYKGGSLTDLWDKLTAGGEKESTMKKESTRLAPAWTIRKKIETGQSLSPAEIQRIADLARRIKNRQN